MDDMLNIILLEDGSVIGNRVRMLIEATEYKISKSICWHNHMAVLLYIEQNKPDVVIICAQFNNDDISIDADILQDINKSNHITQILLVVEKHDIEAIRMALDCDLEWVICLEDESELVENVLHRMERNKIILIQEHVEKMQNLFSDYIKFERVIDFSDNNLLFKDYFNEEYFQVVVVRTMPPYRKRNFLDENNLITLKGYEMLVNRLGKLNKYLIVKDGLDVLVCIIGNRDELDFGKQQLEKFIYDMKDLKFINFGLASWVFMGSIVNKIQDISKSYYHARELISERLFNDNICILEAQDSPIDFVNEDINKFQIFDVRKSLVNSLETFEKLTIRKTLRQLKSNILSITNFNGKDLFSLYKTLLSALYQELESKEVNLLELSIEDTSIDKEYEYFWSIDDVFNSLENYFIEGMNILRAQEESSVPAQIVLAKRYIRSYFNMPLTLSEVSDYVGLTENYFSDYFSKYVKMTFKQFQSDFRIRYSIQLLLDKRYSIKDISETVGYNDVKYFSRVFKRVTGIAPGEYRKKYHIMSDLR